MALTPMPAAMARRTASNRPMPRPKRNAQGLQDEGRRQGRRVRRHRALLQCPPSALDVGLSQPGGVRGPSHVSLTTCPNNRQQPVGRDQQKVVPDRSGPPHVQHGQSITARRVVLFIPARPPKMTSRPLRQSRSRQGFDVVRIMFTGRRSQNDGRRNARTTSGVSADRNRSSAREEDRPGAPVAKWDLFPKSALHVTLVCSVSTARRIRSPVRSSPSFSLMRLDVLATVL